MRQKKSGNTSGVRSRRINADIQATMVKQKEIQTTKKRRNFRRKSCTTKSHTSPHSMSRSIFLHHPAIHFFVRCSGGVSAHAIRSPHTVTRLHTSCGVRLSPAAPAEFFARIKTRRLTLHTAEMDTVASNKESVNRLRRKSGMKAEQDRQ